MMTFSEFDVKRKHEQVHDGGRASRIKSAGRGSALWIQISSKCSICTADFLKNSSANLMKKILDFDF